MKLSKKLSSVVLCFCFFTLLSFVIFAHSGNTDENGGHYDSISDEYHYHHGFPAHQHIDGECPYDFEDRTAAASKYSASNDVSSERLSDEELDEEKFLAATEIEKDYEKEKSRCIAVFSAIAFVYTYLFGYYYGTEVY